MPGTRNKRARDRHALVPKALLADEISAIVNYHHLTQAQTATRTGEAPSQISLLLSGKLRGFSAERLLKILVQLGRDVDLVIRPAAKSGKGGKLRVIRR